MNCDNTTTKPAASGRERAFGTLRRALPLALLSLLVLATAQPGRAQTQTVLYSFTGGADGGYPYAGLLRDSKGSLYGTTEGGGSSYDGTVFEVTPDGEEKVLYSFAWGTDGAVPFAGLVQHAKGNFYGTTVLGGTTGYCGGVGCGTVFEVTPGGKEKVLHRFTGVADGGNPYGGVVLDDMGNLYGTASSGGTDGDCGGAGCGTVFKLTPTGRFKVLYKFTGGIDGGVPDGGLVRDAKGNLYGTAVVGGAFGWGAIFRVTPAGKERVLYSFTGGADGGSPNAGLLRDAAGNLYGVTPYAGGSGCGGGGCGTVFKLTPARKVKVLHSFGGGTDGASPFGVLVRDGKDNVYGTTYAGGTSGHGTVFKVTPAGTETVLYSFTGGTDGGAPWAWLVWHGEGNLYGTTSQGGASGAGVVFELTP